MYQNNPRFRHWSPQFRPRGHFLRPHFVTNRYRYSGPHVQNNYEFWCETCDNGFQTLHILENHKLQHQKCNIDGCQFVAHPKIITKHIQMQHSTGLYKKIAKLNNPEEIQKWREERKLKYPTKKNVEKKAAELKEKLERGEIMGLSTKRHNKHCKPELYSRGKHKFGKEKFQGRHRNYKFKNENTLVHQKPKAPKRVCRTIPKPNDTHRLNPFAGIQHIIIDDNEDQQFDESLQNSLIEDDDTYTEEVTNNVKDKSQLEPTVCGALSTLMNNYGSSDEEVIPDITVVNNSSNVPLDHQAQNDKTEIARDTTDTKLLPVPVCINNKNNNSDDDSGPEEATITKSIADHTVEKNIDNDLKQKIEKKPRINPPNVKHCKKPKYQLPSTLLVKLLSREIEQERNIILQCVRYVVKNNYFYNTSTKE